MKKYCLIITFAMIFLNISSISTAEAIRVIQLKDGSILKGRVLELSNGIYTFETSSLGEITIDQSDILSITSPALSSSSSEESSETGDTQNTNLKNQVQQIQGTILSDEGIMTEIQTLLEDDTIRATLSDPKLLEDVTSFDQQKIEQNTNIRSLMNNPKMQQLMNKVQQRIPTKK